MTSMSYQKLIVDVTTASAALQPTASTTAALQHTLQHYSQLNALIGYQHAKLNTDKALTWNCLTGARLVSLAATMPVLMI
jgi:hypothetical protein